jgi:hypothetical protein
MTPANRCSPDAMDFDPACYCGPGVATDSKGLCTGDGADNNKQPDWDEWFFDLHSPSCIASVQAVQAKRIQTAAGKKCNGIDPDNVDSVSWGQLERKHSDAGVVARR